MKQSEYQEAKDYVYTPIPTGLDIFDKRGAFGSDDFMLIAGSTGSAKTYLAMFMALNAAKDGHKVLFINGEILKSEFVSRMENMGFLFEMDFGDVGDDGYNRFVAIHQDSINRQITYQDIDRLMQEHKPSLLVVDLFGCILDPSTHIPSQTIEYATAFSFYPKRYNCAVIVTEQFVKETRGLVRPDENSIAGGKGLSNKATKVITIFNFYKSNPEKALIQKSETVANTIELIVRKDRTSRLPMGIGMVYCERGFRGLDEEEIIEYKDIVFKNQKSSNAR